MTSVSFAWNGTALETVARKYGVLDGAVNAPALRGENDTVPRRDGAVFSRKMVDPWVLPIGMVVLGANEDGSIPADSWKAFQNNWRTLKALVWSPRTAGTLTRTLSLPSGDVVSTATAEVLPSSLATSRVGIHGRVAVEFLILSGYFYGTQVTGVTPGIATFAGDADTRRITLTLPGAGTLTNSTLGVSVTVTAACTLDVEAFTATAGLAGLSWSGDDYWFVLAPGSNTITWSGAAGASIAYYPAYL